MTVALAGHLPTGLGTQLAPTAAAGLRLTAPIYGPF